MIINVEFPPIDAYNSPEAAITAGKAKSAEFTWFAPKLAETQIIKATAYGHDWFALELSNGKRITITPGETILNVAMDDKPLPQTEPFADEVELRYDAYVGPVARTWEVKKEAEAMVGKNVLFVTFHPRRLILTTPRDVCAWFWLMRDTDEDKPIMKWTIDPT